MSEDLFERLAKRLSVEISNILEAVKKYGSNNPSRNTRLLENFLSEYQDEPANVADLEAFLDKCKQIPFCYYIPSKDEGGDIEIIEPVEDVPEEKNDDENDCDKRNRQRDDNREPARSGVFRRNNSKNSSPI